MHSHLKSFILLLILHCIEQRQNIHLSCITFGNLSVGSNSYSWDFVNSNLMKCRNLV